MARRTHATLATLIVGLFLMLSPLAVGASPAPTSSPQNASIAAAGLWCYDAYWGWYPCVVSYGISSVTNTIGTIIPNP